MPKTTVRRGPQTLTDVFGIACSYLWHQQLQNVHLLPRSADDSRTTWKAPLGRTAWSNAYGCIVWNGLRPQKTLWRLQRGFLVPRNNAKPAFWEIWPWVCAWLCKDDPPPPPHVSKRSAASAKELGFLTNGEWEIMVSDGRKQTNSPFLSLISKLKLSLSFALCSFFKRSSDFIVEDWIL